MTPSEAWSYDGKRVVVTGGGGSGMGAAAVAELADLGAEVHVFDLREPAGEVESFQRVDLKDPDAIAAAVEAVPGTIDALFNCVGVPGPPFVSDLDTMLINFAGVRHLTELVVERMPAGGAVATIASAAAAGWPQRLEAFLPLVETQGFAGAKGWCEAHPDAIATGYGPSKLAVAIWTAYACNDLGARGIRINCTMPGPTETPMLPSFKQRVGEGFWESYPIPIGRFATPAEQGRALVFLNSAAASCITGIGLVTDGGSLSAAAAGVVTLPTVQVRTG